jgi:hypothetical protein
LALAVSTCDAVAVCAAALACVAAAGCAGPFAEVQPSAPTGGVGVRYCGSSSASPGSVLRSLEPPVGAADTQLSPPKELYVCLRLENQGSRPARLNRSNVQLRCPRERQEWVPDRDDDVVIAHPGQSRELHVTFHYTPLVTGEDVALIFDGALTVGGAPVKLRPIVLRKN